MPGTHNENKMDKNGRYREANPVKQQADKDELNLAQGNAGLCSISGVNLSGAVLMHIYRHDYEVLLTYSFNNFARWTAWYSASLVS